MLGIALVLPGYVNPEYSYFLQPLHVCMIPAQVTLS